MAGLIGAGRNTLSQATGGFSDVAAFENARNITADQMKAARKAQRISAVSQGAGIGASIGLTKAAAMAKPITIPSATIPGVNLGVPVAGTPITAAPAAAAAPAASSVLPAGSQLAAQAATLEAAPLAIAAETAPLVASAPVATTTTATTIGGATIPGSAGLGATIGAIATPLLIGAGAALLLDSLFDIF